MTDVEFTKVLPPKTYSVPQRFGMSGILGMTSFMAVIFGSLKFFGAHPSVFLFFGLFAVVMCLVQMRYGGLPRAASIATGAIFLPLSIGVTVV